jgi:hypothetical protein
MAGEQGGVVGANPLTGSVNNPWAGVLQGLQPAVASGKAVAAEIAKSSSDAAAAKAAAAAEGGKAGSGTTGTVILGANGKPAVAGSNDAAALLAAQQAAADQAAKTAAGQSAYDILYNEFAKYGLGSLVEPLKGMITSGASGATLSLALQNTDAYKKRFSANEQRIANGLSALTPAQYIGLEDQYQNVMRQYGLPASYYAKDSTGKQAGFDQLIANDVSNIELEDRVATAQNRVLNANPDVLKTLKQFYPDITNGDILAYALDPKNALTALKQKVTTSEIGSAAFGAGLASGQTPEQIANYAANAQMLQQYGVTGQQAQQNFGQVASLAQRGSQLASIYGQQPYGQQQAQSEVFNLAGQTEAANQRKKLTALEQAQFGGQSGTAQNVFSRERAMSPMMLGVPGAGAF